MKSTGGANNNYYKNNLVPCCVVCLNFVVVIILFAGVYSKVLPYIIFGTISIMAAAISMLLPDPRNNKLPDLISQAKPIRGCVCV